MHATVLVAPRLLGQSHQPSFMHRNPTHGGRGRAARVGCPARRGAQRAESAAAGVCCAIHCTARCCSFSPLLSSPLSLSNMPKPFNIEFGPITGDNVEQLRQVNTACFPVQYQQTFYTDVVQRNNEGLSKFAYWNGLVVGAVCTRVEDILDSENQRLYIMTLGVLAAYRGRGAGSQLIQSVLDYYESEKYDSLKNVTEICLHVQINNQDAIKFYTERFGFIKGYMVENYYRRIDPPHCYLLYKTLR